MKKNYKSVLGLRETLKLIIEQELNELPEILKTLEPSQRLNILCKLMPFVMPKTDSVDCEFGEPLDY